MSVEKPQLEAFWKGEKGPDGSRRGGTNGVKKKGEADLSAEALAKAELEQKAVTLAQEAKRAFSSNDLTQTLEKLCELQRTVGMELVENREQFEKFEREFSRQMEQPALIVYPDKVFLQTIASGVDFLGWSHFHGHRVLRTATKRRMFRNIKINDGKKETVQSYLGLLRHGNIKKLQGQVKEIAIGEA